jgi:predicted permease
LHDAATDRRVRFRESIRTIAKRSSSADLLRWMLIPASILLLLGSAFMLFGWVGASRTAREIEQIPYLISGGLVGLGLVIVGALLLASAFWVVLVRKLLEEQGAQTSTFTSTDGSTPTTNSEPPAATTPRGRVARSTTAS